MWELSVDVWRVKQSVSAAGEEARLEAQRIHFYLNKTQFQRQATKTKETNT